jgi:hypothetical protein
MNAGNIVDFRTILATDPEYREARRDFHEAYEWLEGYWRADKQVNSFDLFCDKLGPYYWDNVSKVKGLAANLACEGAVGNSRNKNYNPTKEVKKAASFLLYHAGIVPDETRGECEAKAREHYAGQGSASQWTESSFKAMMMVVRQIRNNLFHGRKTAPAGEQYERDKRLVALARDIAVALLDHLELAEKWLGEQEQSTQRQQGHKAAQ